MRFDLKPLLLAALLTFSAAPLHAQEVTINAVGDIMLSGSGAQTFREMGYDYPFAAAAGELHKGDISVGNLEAPIAKNGVEFMDKRFRFRMDPKSAGALKRAGFSIVTLANNHIMDFGSAALSQTLQHLDSSGVLHTGAGLSLADARREAVLTVKGVKVAFLAYSITLPTEFYAAPSAPGAAPGYLRYFREDISKAKKSADYVVVSFHWGSECAAAPHPYQTAAAHAAIDAGAAVVLGHHPHVLQGIELYRDGIIFYSLGNFAFGSNSRVADRSMIARITLDKGVKAAELLPLNVLNREVRFQPRLLAGSKGREVIRRVKTLSRPFGTDITDTAGRYLVVLDQACAQGRKKAR